MSADNILVAIDGPGGTIQLWDCGFSGLSSLEGWGDDNRLHEVIEKIHKYGYRVGSYPNVEATNDAANEYLVHNIVEYGFVSCVKGMEVKSVLVETGGELYSEQYVKVPPHLSPKEVNDATLVTDRAELIREMVRDMFDDGELGVHTTLQGRGHAGDTYLHWCPSCGQGKSVREDDDPDDVLPLDSILHSDNCQLVKLYAWAKEEQ